MAARRGFSLIEVLAGLTIASIASVALIGGVRLTRIDTAARLPIAASEFQTAIQTARRQAIIAGATGRVRWQTQSGLTSCWLETQATSGWLPVTNATAIDAAITVTPQTGQITLQADGNASANQTVTFVRDSVTLRVEVLAAGGVVRVYP